MSNTVLIMIISFVAAYLMIGCWWWGFAMGVLRMTSHMYRFTKTKVFVMSLLKVFGWPVDVPMCWYLTRKELAKLMEEYELVKDTFEEDVQGLKFDIPNKEPQ